MSIWTLTWRAMGCTLQAQIASEREDARDALNALPAQVEALEACLSRFRPESELMRFNRQAGAWVDVSAVLLACLQAAKQASRLSAGKFNPFILPALLKAGYTHNFADLDTQSAPEMHTVSTITDWQALELDARQARARIPQGTALDLGGIAKAWSAQRLLDTLMPDVPALLDFGGDIVARATPARQAGWVVAIQEPYSDVPLVHIALRNATIATSGTDYRRWRGADGQMRHHLIDPQTAQPAHSDIVSLSVIHPSAIHAEAYAKAGLLMGSETALNWLSQQWHTHALAVLQDGSVLSTPDFPSFILDHPLAQFTQGADHEYPTFSE